MAGDWIKIQHVTIDKPEVMQIAAELSISIEAAFGHVFRLWVWCDQQSLNGDIGSVTLLSLNHVARCHGLAEAMQKVGWLQAENGEVTIPNFNRHNGQSAKKRAVSVKTSRKNREKKRDTENVTLVSPEKRREELTTKKEIEKERKPKIDTSRGTRLPQSWSLPPDWRQWAEDFCAQNNKPLDVDLEADKFMDYWCAATGRQAAKKNWQATWRNWIRNAKYQTNTQQAVSNAARRNEIHRQVNERLYREAVAAEVDSGVDRETETAVHEPVDCSGRRGSNTDRSDSPGMVGSVVRLYR